MPVDNQLVIWQRRLEADRRPREQSIQVHRDGSVHRDAQGVISVAPIFNESNIRRCLGSGGGHGVMIPPQQSSEMKHCVARKIK